MSLKNNNVIVIFLNSKNPYRDEFSLGKYFSEESFKNSYYIALKRNKFVLIYEC